MALVSRARGHFSIVQDASAVEQPANRFAMLARGDDWARVEELRRVMSWRPTGRLLVYCCTKERAEWLADVIQGFSSRRVQVCHDFSALDYYTARIVVTSTACSGAHFFSRMVLFDIPRAVEDYLTLTSSKLLKSLFVIVTPDYDMALLPGLEAASGTKLSIVDGGVKA